MKQMVNFEAQALKRIHGWRLSEGFFRRARAGGKIFYATETGDPEVISTFPVLEDGSVLRHESEDGQPNPGEEVDILDPGKLGIAEVKWADDN